jgi:hypothetical protein
MGGINIASLLARRDDKKYQNAAKKVRMTTKLFFETCMPSLPEILV